MYASMINAVSFKCISVVIVMGGDGGWLDCLMASLAIAAYVLFVFAEFRFLFFVFSPLSFFFCTGILLQVCGGYYFR